MCVRHQGRSRKKIDWGKVYEKNQTEAMSIKKNNFIYMYPINFYLDGIRIVDVIY